MSMCLDMEYKFLIGRRYIRSSRRRIGYEPRTNRSRRQKVMCGSWTGVYRSCLLSQLIECDVNSFHDLSGPFVVDSVTLPVWCVTNKEPNGSVLGVTGSSHSFCPKKQGSFGEYQHCPSSFNKSAIPSFNNAILLRSSRVSKSFYIVYPGNYTVTNDIIPIAHNCTKIVVSESNTRVQIPENDLYNLHLNKGENGDLDTLDPQLQLGSGWLVHARLYATGAIDSCGSAGIQSLLRAVDLTKGHCLPNGRSCRHQ
ncbi:hypothetical protein Tco_0061074 [Tanacetum coccineum]